MKKASIFLTGLFLILSSLALHAQEKPSDFFLGKWNVVILGTPNGDAKMVLEIKDGETKFEGVISGEGVPDQKVDRVSGTGDKLTVYWSAQGYDVNLNMKKTAEGKVDGSLMGMFTAKIERVE